MIFFMSHLLGLQAAQRILLLNKHEEAHNPHPRE